MYWIEALYRAKVLNEQEFTSIFQDCEELKKLFMSITKTTRNNITRNSNSNSQLPTPNS